MVYDLQKADFWKRISAALFDLIIMGIVIMGVAFGLSALLNYDHYQSGLSACYDRYEVEYGIDFDISTEDYEKLPQETKDKYTAASNAIQKDVEAYYFYEMTVNITLIIIIFSILIGHVAMELVVPLLLKNGQTLGKKIFGIGVMRSDGVRISTLQVFVRGILGKCTVETLVPVMLLVMISLGVTGLLGLTIIACLFFAQIVLLIVTKERTPIHDLVAHTVTVDLYSQLIFDTPEELLAYKQKIQAERAARAEY